MRTLGFLLLFILSGRAGFAQHISGGLSYNYLYAKQLDRSIQLYNFSRPFLQNKQPLFVHGLSAEVSFLFKTEKPIKHGLSLTYSYFGSEAVNEHYTNRFNLHFMNLNYLIFLANEQKFEKFFGEIQIGLSSSALYRRLNGDAFWVDEAKFKALGLGGNIGVKMGYRLYGRDEHQISPFVFLGYTPYLYAPKNEAVLNATQELITKPSLAALNFRIGVRYGIR